MHKLLVFIKNQILVQRLTDFKVHTVTQMACNGDGIVPVMNYTSLFSGLKFVLPNTVHLMQGGEVIRSKLPGLHLLP